MIDEFDDLFAKEGGGPGVRWFTAAYDSECPTCGGRLFEGDRGGYIGGDDQASCESCCMLAEES